VPLNFISFCWRHCTDALLRRPSVQPVLKTWLLHTWHRLWTIVWSLHRCLFMPRRFNRCYWVFLTWLSIARPFHRCSIVGSSETHRLDRCLCVGLTGATTSATLVQLVAAIFLILQKYSISRFYYATVDWTWRLDGDLDMVPWRWFGRGILTSWRWFGLFASTVDWIWCLYGELDIFDFIHGT